VTNVRRPVTSDAHDWLESQRLGKLKGVGNAAHPAGGNARGLQLPDPRIDSVGRQCGTQRLSKIRPVLDAGCIRREALVNYQFWDVKNLGKTTKLPFVSAADR
jgi:hypothetical protein